MGYVDEVLRDRPLGYWPLWEQNGTTARDRSGSNHDATHNGTPVLGAPGLRAEPSKTTDYSVAGRYSQVPSDAAFAVASVALEAWIVRTVTKSNATWNSTIVCRNTTGGWSFRIADASTFYLRLTAINVAHYTTTFTIAQDVPYHVAATVVGTTLTFFVNGAQVQQQTISALSTTQAVVDIGNDSFATSTDYFAGRLSDVAVYASLSPARIRAHYEAGKQSAGRRLHARR